MDNLSQVYYIIRKHDEGIGMQDQIAARPRKALPGQHQHDGCTGQQRLVAMEKLHEGGFVLGVDHHIDYKGNRTGMLQEFDCLLDAPDPANGILLGENSLRQTAHTIMILKQEHALLVRWDRFPGIDCGRQERTTQHRFFFGVGNDGIELPHHHADQTMEQLHDKGCGCPARLGRGFGADKTIPQFPEQRPRRTERHDHHTVRFRNRHDKTFLSGGKQVDIAEEDPHGIYIDRKDK